MIISNAIADSRFTLGEIITTLWIDLQRILVNTVASGNEKQADFLSGRIAGLKMVLPLLKGKTSKLAS